MRLDTIKKTVNGKTYVSHLLRQAYRDNGRVRHRTIANLSRCSTDEIEAIRLALQHKGDLTQLAHLKDDLRIQQGLCIGAVFALSTVAKRLGIDRALGNSQDAKQALWQVLARVIDQGSRLSAVRLAGTHAAGDVWGANPLMRTTGIGTSTGSTRIKPPAKTACFVCVIPMAKRNCSSTTSPAVI